MTAPLVESKQNANRQIGTPSTGPRSFDLGRVLSKFCLISVYLLFAYAHAVSLVEDGFRLSLALLVVFETIMIGYVLTRRDSHDVDFSALAVIAGLAGSFMALGFRPAGGAEDALVGQVVQIAGLLLQLGASASLGRSFGLIPANRGIKSGGMYRLVRHPLYFAYFFSTIGYLINNISLRNVAVLAIGTGFQVIRIRYEERLLSADPDYRSYMQTVRWHLVPGIW
ncbi:MAG: methyltransferase family protein [Acidimicrobiales bacterium]